MAKRARAADDGVDEVTQLFKALKISPDTSLLEDMLPEMRMLLFARLRPVALIRYASNNAQMHDNAMFFFQQMCKAMFVSPITGNPLALYRRALKRVNGSQGRQFSDLFLYCNQRLRVLSAVYYDLFIPASHWDPTSPSLLINGHVMPQEFDAGKYAYAWGTADAEEEYVDAETNTVNVRTVEVSTETLCDSKKYVSRMPTPLNRGLLIGSLATVSRVPNHTWANTGVTFTWNERLTMPLPLVEQTVGFIPRPPGPFEYRPLVLLPPAINTTADGPWHETDVDIIVPGDDNAVPAVADLIVGKLRISVRASVPMPGPNDVGADMTCEMRYVVVALDVDRIHEAFPDYEYVSWLMTKTGIANRNWQTTPAEVLHFAARENTFNDFSASDFGPACKYLALHRTLPSGQHAKSSSFVVFD